MNKEDIISKIKEKAYENVNKKIEEERKRTEDKISHELEEVSRCLKYITNKLVFKKITNDYKPVKYVLADEKMFLEDYNKESKWDKGIKFKGENDKDYEPLFKVNGEYYYDIRYLIRCYEEDFGYYQKRLNELSERFRDIEKCAEELKKQEPQIKKLIEQYKKVEIDEVTENETN